MSNTLLIRRRIKSVKGVRQITKAMELTSAAKMHSATGAVLGSRPYTAEIIAVINHLNLAEDYYHPLLEIRPVKKELLIVISSDKGMSGGLNNQLVKYVINHIKTVGHTVDLVVIGKKGNTALARFGLNIVSSYIDIPTRPDSSFAMTISYSAKEDFLKNSYDVVSVAYNHYHSTLSQKPTVTQLLPLQNHPETVMTNLEMAPGTEPISLPVFEPNASAIMDDLLPRLVHQFFFQYMLEASASEFAARMVAMRNATDNASDLLDDLELTYNSIRQATVTAEMAEISASIGALE
jgi:F-type H+-transporting ATPase subunit gamma